MITLHLSCLHNPMNLSNLSTQPYTHFSQLTYFLINKIRIFKVKRHCQTSGRKPSNLGKPLFISTLNRAYFSTLDIKTTHSTWLVCGNISTGCIFSTLNPLLLNIFKSLARVPGSQDT